MTDNTDQLLEEMDGPIGPGDAPMVDKPLEASIRKASAQVEIWRAQRAALCVADRALQQVAEDEPEVITDGGVDQTSEPIEVEWVGGMGDTQTVRVDPYTGKITVNGREFDIGALCADDVPDWMHRSHPVAADYSGGEPGGK